MSKFKFISLLALSSLLIALSVSLIQMQGTTTLSYPPRPIWSPDGQFIAYFGSEGGYVMDRDGDNVRQITPEGRLEGWTPDSKTLIFDRNYVVDQNEFWFYPVDGSEPQPAFPNFFMVRYYAYSPDGKSVAVYGRKTETDDFLIWLIDVINGIPAADPVLQGDITTLNVYFIYDLKWAKSGDELILLANIQNEINQRKRLYFPLHQPTPNLKIEKLDIEDTVYLDSGWNLSFDPEDSFRPLVYPVHTVSHPGQQLSFPLNRVINGYSITLSTDEQTLFYANYCNPAEVLGVRFIDEGLGYGKASTTTTLASFDLITGIETTIFSCDEGTQVVHVSVSPDGNSILFDVIDAALDWRIYRADLAAGALLDLVDITPAN